MKIDAEKCIGCGTCIPYCNVEAISMNEEDEVAVIDPDVCVECWVCYNNRVCPKDAIEPTPLDTHDKTFKHVLSDPTVTSKGTGIPGRGTEEAKTNCVTGRYGREIYGVCVDMGRPGVGCTMRDVEKVAMALAPTGFRFVGPEENPIATLMTDFKTGKFRDDVLDLHVLSIIIEGSVKRSDIKPVLEALMNVSKEIDTVFSLGVVSMKIDDDEDLMKTLDECGIPRPTRGKVNVGLGRPLFTG
jgi:NAD-dependent dihydropyrimidine dehydrogenase PreA subunit